MPVVTVGTENPGSIDLHYEDCGSGTPVILIHGYPLSGRAWDKQVPVLLAAGHRVITYDRRGLGGSSQPATGYDWDIFAADLATLIDTLGLKTAWQADFRDDLPKIDVPVLVIQGDADRVPPFDKTGKRLPGLIKDMNLLVVEGGPHAIPWTHANQVNQSLLDFVAS